MRGQGPQYEQAQIQREEAHKKALAEDVRAMNIMGYQGDVDGVAGILESRVNTLRQQGGDWTESLATLNMIRSGDPNKIGAALADLAQADQIATANGYLPPIALPQGDKLHSVEGGAGIYQRGDGSLYARPIENYSEPVDPKEEQSQVNTLRKSIYDVTKDMRQVQVSYDKMRNSAKRKTAAGDMSLIFGIMKMNDPGSTVREGEYATAQNAGSVPQQIISFYNSALNGQKLSPEQREDFVGQAETLYQAQRMNADKQIGNVLQQADQDGIKRTRILGDDRLREIEARLESYSARESGGRRLMSSVLGEEVTMQEIEETARNRNKSVEQVMRDLGIVDG